MSGIGKRFQEAGYRDPKPLIKVDGYPIIKHVVDLFPGVDDITFVCNEIHLKETDMRNILVDISPNCRILEVSDKNRRGPVDAVLQIFDHLDENKEIIVSYCDYGTVWNFELFLNSIKNGNYDGMLACYTGFHPHMLGTESYAFCKVENDKVIQIKEKESFTSDKMSEYASNGTYYFKSGHIVKKYFKELINLGLQVNGEYYVSLVYNLLIRDYLKVGIFEIDKMLQWGTPNDLESYNKWSNYFKKIKHQPQILIKNPENTTLILPMAGRGSRFSEIGYNIPKPLIPVENKPMFVKSVECLPKSDSIVFISLEEHEYSHSISDKINENFQNTSIVLLKEITRGQACTCEIAIKKQNINPEHPIMISACDNGVYYDVDKYLKLVNDQNIDVIVWTFRNQQSSKNNPDMYAWLDVDKDDNVLHVSCKKFIYDDPLKTHAIIGTMFFRKSKYFTEGLKKNYEENLTTNNEFYVDEVINQNIKSGLRVSIFEVEDYICWGTPNDYKTYEYWKKHFL